MGEPRGDEPPLLRRIVPCPGCGGDSVYAASNPSRPFCGERCRNADLGAWASEGYRMPAQPAPEDGNEGELPTAG